MDTPLVNIKFFGWCKETVTDNKGKTHKHDKIWAWFMIGNDAYCVWGARGADKTTKLKFKYYGSSSYKIAEVARKGYEKACKGYKPMSTQVVDGVYAHIEEIYPGFTDHINRELVLTKLSDSFRGTK